ncbi:DnaB-like helicase C-terminal domain-containing protein [Xenorhabdus sp. PR6a]|uniref:DnaB-like helicase C-terminal domain-containing protein n=1 Tax=Xenorhabdus sp. PR6a TaxID=3025877 RepID=UPI0023591556|nr:DnaB-like helicase C-terminal domain-containing protein [Xenorhabdus sp. PR6a]MDC9583072.1 DnaB-like helicase C-terminal domain-containing protein [Xenorhabdus sp. PR6a]
MSSSELELEHTSASLSDRFDENFQTMLAAYYCRDYRFVTQAHDLVEPKQFDNKALSFLVSAAGRFYKMYKQPPSMPTLITLITNDVKAKAIRPEYVPDVKTAIAKINDVKLTDSQYMVDQVTLFARSVAFDNAMIKAAEFKDKGDFDKAMQIMDKVKHLGGQGNTEVYDYFSESATRFEAREKRASGEAPPQGITTGYRAIDALLYHKGWGRKEMTLFMGFAKSGKSTGMGEFGVNAALAGFNVLYVSLEVHKEIVADRFDARLSETDMDELVDSRERVSAKLKDLGATGKVGKMFVIQRPPGTVAPNDIVRMIEGIIATGVTLDMLIIDYADLMKPNYRSGDVREDVKSIYTDTRAIFDTYNVAGITASQTNREGGSSEVATMMHAADNVEKVRIADLIITINKTEEEKAKGEARLYIAGSRNQKGEVSVRIEQNLDQMRFIKRIIDIT